MKHETSIRKYYSQLVVESILQSSLLALSIGFLSGFVIFIVGIAITKNLLLVGIIVSIIISISAGLLLYFYMYKPTMKKVAARIDVLGFEERTITMVELQESKSYIAEVQRETTKEILSKFSLNLVLFPLFIKPLIILLVATGMMLTSLSVMITKVNAAAQEEPPIVDLTEDEILQQMIDNLLTIINEAQIDITLKNTLYQMVLDLEQRLPTHDTYMEKYADILQTRNEILQLIQDNIRELEDSLINIAEALQQYETTVDLGDALLTWDEEIIAQAFAMMYANIDVLLGQELYDEMLQTADDIEAALAESVGTWPSMADALQHLADAYRAALENYQPGQEQAMLDEFKPEMDAALEELILSVLELKAMVEELLALEEELEEELEQVDEFPMFIPFPEDSADGDSTDSPTTSDNMVIDGETPYEDVYDSFYEDAMDWLSDESVSEKMRQIIENYFDMLK